MEAGSIDANGIRFHYLAKGKGPLLLCLHGFPDHAHSFVHQLNYFAARGYRVVAPFMRGYAPTETPQGATFHTSDLAHDVVGLVKAFGEAHATLLGHDWGAQAAYAAAVLAPETFDRIVTLAVPYGPGLRSALVTSPGQQKRSWYIFFFQTAFAEAALAHDDCSLVQRLWQDWSPDWTLPAEDMQRLRALFASPAVASAALAYYRHALGMAGRSGPHAELQNRIGAEAIGVPCLYLHGARDACIDPSVASDMDRLFAGGLDRRVVANAGHFLHLERPDEVNGIIAAYLRGR